jgi:hypothetical protein
VQLRAEIEKLVQSAGDAIGRLPDKGRTVRFVAAVALFLLALGVLVSFNVLLRAGGLWGDLLFALIVTTAVLWALNLATRRLLRRGPEYRAFPRAMSATLLVLVGAPVAVATRPTGLVILLAPLAVWGLAVLLHRTMTIERNVPPFWIAGLVSVGLILIFVAVRPTLSRTEKVPRAVPAAQLEETNADLARQFRPLLFFDSGEQRYPLDIEQAISDGRIEMCRGGLRRDACEEVKQAASIDDSFDFLEVLDAPTVRRGGDSGSAYYYHVVRDGQAVYVDYWWFYSRNPSPVAGDVFCGPGFRTPPFTCQEHSGDWEGLTMVLGACPKLSATCVDVGGERLRPTAVRYGEHESVVERAWSRELERIWRSLPHPTSAALKPVWDEFVLPAAAAHGTRALVFVARNSHASYPFACLRNCRQTAADLPDGRYDGGQPWSHNTTCDGCLKPLPITAAGEPATWNAFSGRWGAQRCILGGAYCDLAGAPEGPSRHSRYTDPAGGNE